MFRGRGSDAASDDRQDRPVERRRRWKVRAMRYPTPGAERPGSRDLRQLRRLAGFLRPYRWQAAATLVALVVAAGAVLVFGIGLRYLIDGAFAAGRTEALEPWARRRR